MHTDELKNFVCTVHFSSGEVFQSDDFQDQRKFDHLRQAWKRRLIWNDRGFWSKLKFWKKQPTRFYHYIEEQPKFWDEMFDLEAIHSISIYEDNEKSEWEKSGSCTE